MKRRNFFAYSILFLSGCAGTTVAETSLRQTSNLSQSSDSSQTSSLSQMPERPTTLRFAVTDLSGLETLEQDFGPFRVALESVLEIPITFYPVSNYSAAAPALLANDLDLALAGPSEYLLLRGRAQAEPLIQVSRSNYYSVIMVRADSGIKTLSDLKGQTISMHKEGSTAGHIFPMKLLMDAGVKPEELQIKMLGDQGVDALLAGDVAAWTSSHRRYVEFVKDQGLDQEIIILSQGEPLPGDIFVANPSLGADFIQELRTTMLTHHEMLLTALASSPANQKYSNSRMVAAQDSDYETMRSIYQAIGLESAIQ